MNRLLGLVGFLALSCSGCANTDANLRRETARNIGNLTPDEVVISNVARGMTAVDWKATTPKGHYVCSADDMLHRVSCVKREK